MGTTKHTKDTKRTLPDGWRWVRLGEVCELNPRRPLIERQDETPTTFIPMEAVDAVSGTVVDQRVRPFGEIKKGYTYFAEGDVLFAKITPCMQNGKHAIAEGLIDGIGFGTTEFHVLRAGPCITPEWMRFFVRQPEVLLKATEHFTGAVGQQRLPPDYLADLEIPLPPLDEQRQIAGVLREQMAAVEKARTAAQARLEAVKDLPTAFLRQVFDAPEVSRWVTRRLGDILIPHKEIIHPGDRENGTSEFVGLEHLEPHTGRRLGSLTLDLAHLTGRKPTFRRGQIVYGYLRPYLNKVWIAEFDGCSSVDQFAYGVRSDLADVRFVAWFMRSTTYLRRSQVVTTTGQLPRIGTEEIAAVEIGLPPLSEQQRIAGVLQEQIAAVEKARAAAETELETINALPATLLRRAFAGKL